MTTTRVPRHDFSGRASGKSKIRGRQCELHFAIVCQSRSLAIPHLSPLFLPVHSEAAYPHGLWDFSEYPETINYPTLDMPEGPKLQHREMM